MQRLVIAVDCDDVIVESTHVVLKHYRDTYGVTIEPADAYSLNPTVWGVAHADDAIARVVKFMETADYQTIPPIQEAVTALRTLKAHHEIHLVTGRQDFLQSPTLAWLTEHFPDVFTSTEFTNFIVPTSHRHITRSKADVAKQLAADIFIEDHPHHAQIVADTGVQVLLFDSPWNRSFEPSMPNITRVKNWHEILRIINDDVTFLTARRHLYA